MKIHHFAFIVELTTNNVKPIGRIKITMIKTFFKHFDIIILSFFFRYTNNIRLFDINVNNDFENIDSNFIRNLFIDIEKINVLDFINENIDITYKYNNKNFVEIGLKKELTKLNWKRLSKIREKNVHFYIIRFQKRHLKL